MSPLLHILLLDVANDLPTINVFEVFDNVMCDNQIPVGRQGYVAMSRDQRDQTQEPRVIRNLTQTIQTTDKLNNTHINRLNANKRIRRFVGSEDYDGYRQGDHMWHFATSDPYEIMIPKLTKLFGQQVTLVVPANVQIPGGWYKEGGFDVEATLTHHTSYLCTLAQTKLQNPALEQYTPVAITALKQGVYTPDMLFMPEDDQFLPIQFLVQALEPNTRNITKTVLGQMARLKSIGAQVVVFFPFGIWTSGIQQSEILDAYRRAIYVAKKSHKFRAIVLMIPNDYMAKQFNTTLKAVTLNTTFSKPIAKLSGYNIPVMRDLTNIMRNWMHSSTKQTIKELERSYTNTPQPRIGQAFSRDLEPIHVFQFMS